MDDRQMIVSKIRSIAQSIEAHLIEYNNLKSQDGIYTPEYLADKRAKMRADFIVRLSGALNALIFMIIQYRKDIEVRREQMERAYIPESKQDELLYYERKREYLEKISKYSPDRIINIYEDAVHLNNAERVQFFEDSGYNLLSQIDTTKDRANKLDTLISLNKRERSAPLLPEYSELRKYESLERTAQRLLAGYEHGDFNPADAYTFYSLASNLEQKDKKMNAVQFKQYSEVEL